MPGISAPPSLARIAFACLVLIVTGFLVAQAYVSGERRGMRGMVPDAVDTQNKAIAIAISRDIFGFRRYVGDRRILNILVEAGMTQWPDPLGRAGLHFPENIRDAKLMDAAIEKALAFGPQPAPGMFGDRTWLTGEADDLGLVDYYWLAFRLLGYTVSAPYDFYFLLVLACVVVYGWRFWRQPLAMFLLAAWALGLCATISLDYFARIDLGTVHNQRFLSSLAILPYLHIGQEILARRPLRITAGLALLFQIVLLMFAVSIRQSAMWALVALAVLGALSVFRRYRSGERSPVTYLKREAPLALLLVVASVLSLARNALLHDFYDWDDVLPHRMSWHSAFIGLEASPKWPEVVDKRLRDFHADALVHKAAEYYLADRYGIVADPFAVQASVYTGTFKWRLHERLVRASYISFARKNPKFMLRLILYDKPRRIIEIFRELSWIDAERAAGVLPMNRGWRTGVLIFVMLLGVLAIKISGSICPRSAQVVGAGGVFVLAPPLWAFPAPHTLGEQYVVGIFVAACLGPLIMWGVYRVVPRLRVWHLFRQRMPNH